MSVDLAIVRQEKAFRLGVLPAWIWLGIWVYAIVLINGNNLLNDSDTYWQIGIGKSILEHQTMPRFDIYSFTRAGEPWISSSWLAQVLYAASFELLGWTGPVVLAAISIAATFALLVFALSRRISSTIAILIAFAALVVSANHLLARPHTLAWPVMLAWAYGLVSASERGEAPSFRLLPLIALWANLHGGFVFGLVLAGGFALDAVWNADASRRKPLVLRWAVFGVGALLACCATPYGWESLLASRRILDLGELLHLISEWMPVNFGTVSPFEVWLLAALGGALFGGVRLSPPRILLLLGLLHMALSHVRNVEILVLLGPLVVLGPVAAQFRLQGSRPASSAFPAALAAMLAVAVAASTAAYAAHANFAPTVMQSPAAAVDVLKSRNPKRVLNDLQFGGYLIWRGVPVFVDGRAELYGEQFEMNFFKALQLKDVNLLFEILKRYDIDAVMLTPATPAAGLLAHLAGWERIHADEHAVVYLRQGDGSAALIDHDPSK
jgi:hypothetical protein